MPKPVPVPVRRKLLQLSRRGQGGAALAAAFGLPIRTVRHLLKRFRDRGEAAVDPDYRAPGRCPTPIPPRSARPRWPCAASTRVGGPS
jgi:hypothetical protein